MTPTFRSALRVVMFTATAAATGLASAQQGDPAQIMNMINQRLQAMQLGAGMQAPGLAQPAAPQRPAQPQMPESQLAATMAAWSDAKGPFAIEGFRDGFSIDGERMLDPEGTIVKFSVDAATGDASYLTEIAPGQYALKVMRHGTGAPVTYGTAVRQMGVWSVETVTGVRVAGPRMIVMPRGFSIARDNAMFTYTAGAGLKSFALPESFVFAAHQNGNVHATKWLLLEKRAETKRSEEGALGGTELGKLFSTVKQLGATVGVTKADADYALYNVQTKAVVPIHISLDDNQANFLSQCRQRNRWVAQCDRLDSIESLYGQDGSPNRQHYFWRLAWFQTPQGPVAVSQEDSISKIEAVDLTSGRRVPVFSRALGIGGWSVQQGADGKISVSAQMGLTREVQADVAKLFDEPIAAAAAPAAADIANSK